MKEITCFADEMLESTSFFHSREITPVCIIRIFYCFAMPNSRIHLVPCSYSLQYIMIFPRLAIKQLLFLLLLWETSAGKTALHQEQQKYYNDDQQVDGDFASLRVVGDSQTNNSQFGSSVTTNNNPPGTAGLRKAQKKIFVSFQLLHQVCVKTSLYTLEQPSLSLRATKSVAGTWVSHPPVLPSLAHMTL